MSLLWAIPAVVLLLGCEAFLSGSEIAFVSANRARLKRLAEEGMRGPRLLLELLEKPEWMMATLLTCHNLVFVTNVTLVTALMLQHFEPHWGELLTLVVMLPLIVTLGEIVPKSLGQERADGWASRAVYPIWFARRLFAPVVFAVTRLTRLLLRLTGADARPESPYVTREELELLVETAERGGDVRPSERRMIDRIFDFGERRMDAVMVPLVEVDALEDTASVEDAIGMVERCGHSRIPVYRGEIHHIVGVVHARDILALEPAAGGRLRDVPSLVRPPYFVPESKRADDLLEELRANKNQMAIVVDEYGGSVGIVTLEDLLEEIVGEIRDEYDTDRPRYARAPGDVLLVDARIEVKALREELGVQVPEGRYDTLGGFLLAELERIPRPGEAVIWRGMRFVVEEASERRIERVRIEPGKGEGAPQ
ncbi:MAG: hemolysin family protein [Nitrospinota bacterium]